MGDGSVRNRTDTPAAVAEDRGPEPGSGSGLRISRVETFPVQSGDGGYHRGGSYFPDHVLDSTPLTSADGRVERLTAPGIVIHAAAAVRDANRRGHACPGSGLAAPGRVVRRVAGALLPGGERGGGKNDTNSGKNDNNKGAGAWTSTRMR